MTSVIRLRASAQIPRELGENLIVRTRSAGTIRPEGNGEICAYEAVTPTPDDHLVVILLRQVKGLLDVLVALT
jgi:hypothetical protein